MKVDTIKFGYGKVFVTSAEDLCNDGDDNKFFVVISPNKGPAKPVGQIASNTTIQELKENGIWLSFPTQKQRDAVAKTLLNDLN